MNNKEVENVVFYSLGILKSSGLYVLLEDIELFLIMNGSENGLLEIGLKDVFIFVELWDIIGVLLVLEIIY